MLIGIVSIIGVIVYKSMGKKERVSVTSPAQTSQVTQLLGQGEDVVSISADGGYLFVLVEGQGVKTILQMDAESGQLVRRTQFIPQGK